MKLPASLTAHHLSKSIARTTLATCLSFLAVVSSAQVTQPTLQGTSVPDAAVPSIITAPTYGTTYFVLNRDLSTLTHSTDTTNLNQTCAAPAGLSSTGTAPRTQLNDTSALYVTAQSSTGSNVAAVAIQPGTPCLFSSAVPVGATTPTQTLTSNDRGHGRFFVVNASASGPDIITVFANLNTNTSSTPTLTQQARTSLDSGATYTSIVTDTRSNFGLTAVTELKTNTSPGNLWVYSPGIQTAFKILGPGGVPLPALSSFIIPSPNDGGGSLLVLVNQDGLTAANQTAPPQDTTPFTIIDLGQLQRAFSAVVASGNTVTLPFVTQVHATTPFYAMLGATYNPVNHLAYAVVAGGSSSSSVVENIISYDITNPSSPNETVVADISSIPFTLGSFPQLALNAVSGTMQILTSNPSSLYSVGINGTGNIPVPVTGSVFPDSNFAPTYIASNPLMGETYIASSSGQIDVLTKPAAAPYNATLTMSGPDNAVAGQSYTLTVTSNYAHYDAAEVAAPVTITATPAGGTPYTFATGTIGDYADCNCGISSKTFPAAGVYTLVATTPATANYAAVTSNPVVVTVGATAISGVYPTTLTLTVPSTSSSNTVNATVTLNGSTYAPTGRIVISDANGEVGRLTLAGGILPRPATIPVTLVNGASTLTAVYNGDSQNQASTSATASITVGAVAKVTPTITLALPSSPAAGSTATGTISLFSSSTTPPTGNITIYSVPPSSTTPVTLATVPAAQAYASGGKTFSFTVPAAGASSVFASYDGDSAYNLAFSPTYTLTSTSSTIATTINISAPAATTAGVTFTANITLKSASASTPPPSGNVILTATPTSGSPSTVTYTAAQAFASGGYAAQIQLSAAGTYTLTASYAGDANYGASSGSVTTVVSAPPPITPTLSLSVPTSATAGTSQAGLITYDFSGSTATATGNILIVATSTTSLKTTLATINASQTKGHLITTFSFTAPPSGTYAVTAVYAGDAAFNAVTSNVVTLAVTAPGFTTTTLGLSAPATVNPPTAFTATIRLNSATTPPSPPTGNVVLTATPTSGGAAITVANMPATQAIVSGGTTTPVTLLTVGSYTLTASYAGDSNYGPSTASVPVNVALAQPTISLTGPSTGVAYYVFGAYLAGTAGTPTGNITFTAKLNGSTAPALTSTVNASGAALNSANINNASFNFTTSGTYTITASYPGDTYNSPATASTPLSVLITIPIVPTSFKMTFDNTSYDASLGFGISTPVRVDYDGFEGPGDTKVGITLTALSGFNSVVKLSLDGIPKSIDATFLDANGVVITSTTPVAAGTHIFLHLTNNQYASLHMPGQNSNIAYAGGLLGAFGLLLWRKRKQFSALSGVLTTVCVVVVGGVLLSGCGANKKEQHTTVTVTGTPVNAGTSATPQTIQFDLTYFVPSGTVN